MLLSEVELDLNCPGVCGRKGKMPKKESAKDRAAAKSAEQEEAAAKAAEDAAWADGSSGGGSKKVRHLVL